MSAKFKLRRGVWIFVIRNIILYFLYFNAYLHLKHDLDIVFLSICFVIAVFTALLLEKIHLRLWAALLSAAVFPFLLRLLFFLIFRLQIRMSPGPETDFLFFFFDKNFYPALMPIILIWLFNFLALRFYSFIFIEVGLNALLLLLVFWSQGRYRITLYPHPSLFAFALLLFLLLEILVLILARKKEIRSLFSFAWILIPLLIILLLFLLGRFNEGAVRMGGGLMKPTLFRFDFTQFIKLESEIEMSDDLVLLFRKEGASRRILLRRYILSEYEKKKGFYRTQKKDIEPLPLTVPDSPEELVDPEYLSRSSVEQEYFFINFDPSSLIGMNYPVRVAPLVNWDSSSFLRIYRVLSRVSSAAEEELESAEYEGLSSDQLHHYTRYENNESIKKLADEITDGEENTYNKVLLIRDYLKDNYFYSLKPGLAVDGNQLSHFLFKSKKAYCSYFAFAMTLLCRSIGIPARVAVGFYVNPEMEILNFYEVRANQAHAWVEVYFGKYGWIEFDPSSEEIAPGEEYTVHFGFDFERFSSLIEEIIKNQDMLKEEATGKTPVVKEVFRLGKSLVKTLLLASRLWYIVLPSLYLLILTGIKCYPLLLFVLSVSFRKKIKYLFKFSLVKLYGVNLIRTPVESWIEYADRIDKSKGLVFRPLAEYYLEAVFAGSFGNRNYQCAFTAWREFSVSFRQTNSPALRVFAFLNPLNSLRRKW